MPTIVPCLWFDDQAEAAAKAYTSIFPGSSITATTRYPESFDNPSEKPRGSVMTVEVELAGTSFTLLNGGPVFTPNPTISFFAHTDTVEEAERIATALAEGGTYLMELDAYPWSPRYAWVQDRFGVSWQVMASPDGHSRPPIVPCLMFAGPVHGRAEEALRRYASLFPNGSVEALEHYTADEGPEGTIKHGRVSLDGQPLVAMDSHLEHEATFNEGVSLQVLCRDQAEVDRYWEALTANGGEESLCGWLKDPFGVSWQIVPTRFLQMRTAGDGAGSGFERAWKAMLEMKRLDLAALEAAYEQV